MDLIDAASFYSKYGSHSSDYGCFSRHWQSNSSYLLAKGMISYWRLVSLSACQPAQVQTLGRTALSVPTDVRDPDQVNTLVHKALEQYGAIDVLVNNAGIYISSGAVLLSDWHQAVDTNFGVCPHPGVTSFPRAGNWNHR